MGKIQKIREQKKLEAELEARAKKKKTKKRLTIALISILALAIIVIGFFYITSLIKSKKTVKAVIEIDKGNIELELYKYAAPNTVDNFVKLSKEGFYDGTKFHRVVTDFVIQGGDPLSKNDNPDDDGTGGPGYVFDDEINPKSLGLADDLINVLQQQGYTFSYLLKSIPHKVGTISMANSGPNTNGSQFFIITTQDQPDLDGRYTAFGQVVEGMDIVRNIQQNDIIKKIIIKN